MRWSTNQQAGSSSNSSRQGEESQFEIRTRTQSQVQLGLINALCRATRKLTLHALTLDKRTSEQPQCGGQVSLIALRIDLNRCTLHFLCIFMARMKPKSNSKLQSLERQLSRAQKIPAPFNVSLLVLCIVTARSFTLCWTLTTNGGLQTGPDTDLHCGGKGKVDLNSLRGLLGWFGHWHADFCSRQNCRQIVYTGMKLCWPGQARQTTERAQECCCFCACCRCLLLRLWLLECA